MVRAVAQGNPSPGGLPAPGRREQSKAENRAAILSAARDVFSELGYGASTIRDIIRRTGLASGTFYNYFRDKELVLRALLEESVRELRARVRTARTRAGNLEHFVGDAYRAYFEFAASDRAMFELLKRNAGTIRTIFDEPVFGIARAELLDDLRAMVGRGQIPPDVDLEYLMAAMVGVAFEVGTEMVERETVDPEGAAVFATELFLGAIERLRRGPRDGVDLPREND